MHVGLDNNVDSTDPVEGDFDVGVLLAATHLGHVLALGVVLLVALGEDGILIQGCSQSESFRGLLPRVVVKAALDVFSVFVAVEPNIYIPRISSCPRKLLGAGGLLGTKMSLSCLTKSSMMFVGCSTISTSRQ